MSGLNFYKVTSLPATPEHNSVYLVEDGLNYAAYYVDNAGTVTTLTDPDIVIRAITYQTIKEVYENYTRVTGLNTISTNTTEDLISYTDTVARHLRSVVVSGNGNAIVSIYVDNDKKDQAIINRQNPRVELFLGYALAENTTFRVAVECLALGDSDFFGTLLYK